MTEEEWLAGDGPARMLEFLSGNVSERKLRLFAVACCLSTGGETTRDCEKLGQNIRLAEQMAEGATDPPNSLGHYYGFYTIHHGSGSSLEWACHAATDPSAWHAASAIVKALDDALWEDGETNCGVMCLREIFGNPFRPVAFNSAWRTTDVMLLARGIYEEKAFDRSPILADALQDAGCDSDALLAHLRDTTAPHVRGCWALDLVLGKE